MESYQIFVIFIIIFGLVLMVRTFVGLEEGTVASSNWKRHRIDRENWERRRRREELYQRFLDNKCKHEAYAYVRALDEEDLWEHDYRDRPKRSEDYPSPEAIKKWLEEEDSARADE